MTDDDYAYEISAPSGSLCILNVGAGDIEIRFNHEQPDEVRRAIAMLQDMQRRGYAILVKQPDGSYVRAITIDGATAAYVISDPPAAVVAEEEAPAPRQGKRRGRPRRQPIADSQAVAFGRSAGG